MKRNYILVASFIIFVLFLSFASPYIGSGEKGYGFIKEEHSLDSFVAKNDINKENVVKLDDNYYALKNDNKIIDLENNKIIDSKSLVKNRHAFKELLFTEFRKKYPLFIVESILDNDYTDFNVFDNMIYVSYTNSEGNKYDATLICRDYKDYVEFGCIDDIEEDPNVITLDPNKKIVALTFDDGPCVNTDSVIEQLNNFNMKATFFELGSLMERYPEMVKKVKENGFEIGSHGYSHKSFVKLKVEGTAEELNRTNDIYKSITGEDIKLVRPPYGAINQSIRDSMGITFIKWSVDSLDWKVKDERYVENIMSTVRDGDIILVHDIQATTAEHLSELLMRLYNEEYQVVTVSELASIKGTSMEGNKVYFHFRNE